MNYQDTLDHLHTQLQEHGKVALERFARKVITALETQVRDEEVAQELTIEQPHYRRLRLLVREQDWNERRIGAELDSLDQVAAALGDDYPADNVAPRNLAFASALDYWRHLQTDISAATATAIAALYLDNADDEATPSAPVDATWSSHPQIAPAFAQLEAWIAATK